MKRSFFIRIIALAASVALLAGALVVAAVTGSPYELLKGALLNTGKFTSHSVNLKMVATLDGEEFESEDTYNEFVEGVYSLTRNAYGYESYQTGAGNLTIYDDARGNFYSYGSNQAVYISSPMSIFGVGGDSEDPRYMRLFEMGLDLIVGDLKNNIAMSQTGDIRHVSGTLTANQIPELYNAAFDLIMAENTGSYSFITSEYDVNTLNMADKTIEYKYVFISDSKLYEDTTLFTLHPIESFSNYISPGDYDNMQNGEIRAEVLYQDGVYYQFRHKTDMGQKEIPLTEAMYYEYKPQYNELPPVQSAKIMYVHGEADIDGEDMLRKLTANASISLIDIFGKAHELDIKIDGEINKIDATSNARYDRIIEALGPNIPDTENYFDISFVLDENDNPIIENIYDGSSSNYKYDNSIYSSYSSGMISIDAVDAVPYPTEMPDLNSSIPVNENGVPYYDLWLSNRVFELAADPIYAGLDVAVLETIAYNEYVALYGEVE